jgi:hypothetical protein
MKYDKIQRWYPWSQGARPVSGDTIVEVLLSSGPPSYEPTRCARDFIWDLPKDACAAIVAFKIIKFAPVKRTYRLAVYEEDGYEFVMDADEDVGGAERISDVVQVEFIMEDQDNVPM